MENKETKNCTNYGSPVKKKSSCMSVGCLVVFLVTILVIIISSIIVNMTDSPKTNEVSNVSWGQIKYTHGAVNVRSQRTKTSNIVNTLGSNEAVKVDFLKDNWYAVFRVNENERNEEKAQGYVYAPILFNTKHKKENTNANVNNSNELAYQLATINKGGYVSKSDVSITRFNYLLNTLDKKTIESKQEIADMTVTCQKILREKYGVEMSLLDIMERLNETIPSGIKVQYAEIASFFIQTVK